MNTTKILLTTIATGLVGVAGYTAIGSAQSTAPATEPSANAAKTVWHNCLTREVWSAEKQAWCQKTEILQNAEYPLESSSVQLTNGSYENPARYTQVTLLNREGTIAYGDLNGDGVEDAATILVVNMGGSGNFVYLTVAIAEGDTLVPQSSTLMGDRVNIRNIAIDQGKVVVDAVIHDDDDPACCPTLAVIQTYALQEQLTLLSQEATGQGSRSE